MVYDFFERLLSIFSDLYFAKLALKLYLQNVKQESFIICNQANIMILFFVFDCSIVASTYFLYARKCINFLLWNTVHLGGI